MKSIRYKLAVYVVLMMALVILVGLLLNGLFLEKYYVLKNRATFVKVSQAIETIYQTRNKQKIVAKLQEINRGEGISSMILTKERMPMYSTFKGKNQKSAKIPKNMLSYIKGTRTIYTVSKPTKGNNSSLIYVARFSTGDSMLLRKSLKGINENAAIANQFFMFSGIVLVLLSGLLVLLFARRITKPILEMSRIADAISQLNFNHEVTYRAQDELGHLGQSMNRISRKLSESLSELKQDVERRKLLVRNLSHELKTPIGVVKGYAEGLQFGVANTEEKRDMYLKIITEECDKMDILIRDMLRLSMLESGIALQHIDEVDVSKTIANSIARFQFKLAEKDIQVNVDDVRDIVIQADAGMIQSVVDNYLSNAITHVDVNHIVTISTSIEDDSLKISVYNSGEQISEQDSELIWDVFYKSNQVRGREDGGHGLGLSIVKWIATLHHGKASFSNKPYGVQFDFYLPLSFHTDFTKPH
jgi:signal transduction histidine kinase